MPQLVTFRQKSNKIENIETLRSVMNKMRHASYSKRVYSSHIISAY